MIKWIFEKLFGAVKWPFENGQKTTRGLIVLGLSVLVRFFADSLPHQPSTEELELVVSHGEEILDSLAGILEIFGASLSTFGLTHKAAKKALIKDPQWE